MLASIWQTLADGGWVMVPLFLLSLTLYASAWELLAFSGRGQLHRQDEAQLHAAVARPESAAGTLGHIVNYALADTHSTKAVMHRFAEMRLALCAAIERRLAFLATLVAVAPLLGLLGTVIGMLGTFAGLASSGGRTIDTVSAGVSQALITTQTGLMVSLPGVFLVLVVRRRCHAIEAALARLENLVLARVPAD